MEHDMANDSSARPGMEPAVEHDGHGAERAVTSGERAQQKAIAALLEKVAALESCGA